MVNIIASRVLLFAVLICLINIFVFLYIPSSDYTFNLSLAFNEPWRFFTFQFFHVDMYHLLENVIGLIFIALVATELDINFKIFLPVYLLSIFVVILPIAIAFPLSTVAGNSTGIYGLLALCLVKSRKLISAKITMPLIAFSIFFFSITNFFVCGECFATFFTGEFFHFSSFLTGVCLSFIPKKRSEHILTRD